MITSRYFGDAGTGRRLGNQLFELASLVGLSHRYGLPLFLPREWEYAHFFQLPQTIAVEEGRNAYVTLHEPAFTCCLDFFDRLVPMLGDTDFSVDGYLQSEKYWKDAEDDVRRMFAFSQIVKGYADRCVADYGVDTENGVAISVRRGDFVTNPHHYLLPKEYYVTAYGRHFEGRPAYVFSDDADWCEANFRGMAPTVAFARGMSPICQLALMARFGNFIIANSTFSWWGAYLSAARPKRVVRPVRHFDGGLLGLDLSDHYPDEWVALDHLA